MAGGSPSSKKFCQYLEHRFPKAHIELKLLANDGTDSFWFLANSEILARAEPDLVVLDYSSNDLFVDSASSAQMRAACEQIIRKTLILPKRPALLILSLFRRLDQSRDQYEFEDNVYARVAAAYNVTLVSYRSAVWPRFEEVPSSKFWNGHGVHPFWYIHQLIADLMAYACEVAMVSQKDLSPRYDVTTNDALGPPLFSDSFINSLDTCEQALTSYDHQNGNLKVAGRRGAASHWSYWDLRRGKEGWQFTAPLEATRNNKESQEQKSRSLKMRQPKPLRKAARSNARRNVARNNVMAQAGSAPGHPLLGVYEGISFEMNFSSSPGLVVTFLRSYENFGQAVVSIDGNEAQILEMLQIQREYRETCDRITRRGKNVLKPASLRHAKPCTQHLAGSLVDPWSLDGHWADNSSLASVIAFTETFAIKNDRYLRGNAAVPKNFKGPAVVVPDRSLRPFIQPGLHNVTISFVRSNDAGRSRFKVMALKSC